MTTPAHDPRLSLKELLSRIRVRQPIVVLDGPPLSGITRTMWECLQETHGDGQLINQSPADLVAETYAHSFDNLSPYQKYVVWLDDLTPAGLVLLQPEILEAITVHATVVANITTAWRNRVLGDNAPLTAGARSVLTQRAHRITVPFALSPEARRRAQAAFPHVAIGASLAESLTGGDVLLAHFANGVRECSPGHVLTQAAIDVRRAGVHRPLTLDDLRALFDKAWPEARLRRATTTATDTEFAEALHWATTPPPGAVRGLLVQRQQGWTAFNYLAGSQDGANGWPDREIPHTRWVMMLDVLPKEDAFNIGVAAHLRGLPGIADAAFRAATKCRDAVIAGSAMTARDQISVA